MKPKVFNPIYFHSSIKTTMVDKLISLTNYILNFHYFLKYQAWLCIELQQKFRKYYKVFYKNNIIFSQFQSSSVYSLARIFNSSSKLCIPNSSIRKFREHLVYPLRYYRKYLVFFLGQCWTKYGQIHDEWWIE